MIAPPYSREFVNIFLPIVKNDSITGILKNADKKDDVSKFLCKFFARLFIHFIPFIDFAIYQSILCLCSSIKVVSLCSG